MKGMKKIWSSVTHKYLVLKQPLAPNLFKKYPSVARALLA